MEATHTIEHGGCRLSYRVHGAGPPVLLIQGTAVHGDGWRPQLEGLTAACRCLWFDNRGMGASQPADGRLSVAQMADDARALLDAQGWGSAHVVGHSLGGLIALQLALSDRARVRSLALLCTFADGRAAGRLSPAMLWLSLRMHVGPRRMRRRAFLELVMPQAQLADADALAERLAPIFGYDLAEQPLVAMRQLAAMRACDLTARLPELAGLPTLVVAAAHDQVAPPALGRALAAGIPGAAYVEFPDAGHGLPIQCAGQVNELLGAHIAQAERAAAPPHMEKWSDL